MGSTRSAETLDLDHRVQANQHRLTAELQPSMLMFDLPVLFVDSILAIFEANARLWDEQMPARKAGEPTVILLE